MKVSRAGIALFGLLSTAPLLVQAQWSNQPSGFQTAFDSNMSSITGMEDVYHSTIFSTDNTAPMSPSGVAIHRLGAFATTGGGQTHWYTTTPQREMFVGMMWRVNAQWQGRTAQDKLFFMRNGANSNGLFEFVGGPTKGGPMVLIWAHNSGNVDNSHICGGAPGLGSGGNCYPNVGSGAVGPPGTWNKIEAYLKTSTTLTSRDGEVRWWINGQLAGAYTGVNYGTSAGLNEFVWNETWDGSGDMGKSNTVVWEHYIDHLHISMRNAVSPPPPPSSPPPPPPTAPPPPTVSIPGSVTDLTLSRIGSSSVTLAFTQVDDGAGAPAKYDVRLSSHGALWGGGSSVTQGTCSTPLAGTATSGALTCTVLGLTASTRYDFQLIAFRGTLNQGATYGGLSNMASATTSAGQSPPTTDVNKDGTTNITDIQLGVNQALGSAACASGDVNGDGACTVIDVQKIVNSALGLGGP